MGKLCHGTGGLVSQWGSIINHHECALSQVTTHIDMALDVARM